MTPDQDAADALVIFGITGDLARKMTFQALYLLFRRHGLSGPVLSVADVSTSDRLVAAKSFDTKAETSTGCAPTLHRCRLGSAVAA